MRLNQPQTSQNLKIKAKRFFFYFRKKQLIASLLSNFALMKNPPFERARLFSFKSTPYLRVDRMHRQVMWEKFIFSY
jgi:hypothetical protein